MVFEQFLESDTVKKHALFIFLLGVFYVIIGYIASDYFFSEQVSIAMLFTITLLLTPSIYTILNIEEKLESKEGARHFFHNHKDIFKIYLLLFVGIFFAFILLNSLSASMFEFQLNVLESRGDLVESRDTIQNYQPSFSNAVGKITNNLLVVIIAFVLSVFYGAGALFLIVLNASVFAAFIIHTANTIGNAFSIISLFMIHLIPELSGFLIAAIAGGVISRAIMKERIGSNGFKNVLRDAFVMLLIAAGLIIIAAFLEVYVSPVFVRAVI